MTKTWLDAFTPECSTWYHNKIASTSTQLVHPDIETIMPTEEGAQAKLEIQQWTGYEATPLHRLGTVAKELKVANIYLKDESPRFGLGSFKALGGAYAVFKVLSHLIKEQTGIEKINSADLRNGTYEAICKNITVVTATDGNHGKSVAWGAREFGCQCKIYIHREVSKGREQAIAKFGCEMVRISGNYDDSVRQADMDSHKNNWHVVSDTSYPGYMDVPKYVMQGYTILASEISEQIDGVIPTHVFLPGGVGGIAAAVSAELWRIWGKNRPKVVVVEPRAADCLYQSALSEKPMMSHGNLETVMACLSAGEVSLLAWDILSRSANTFMILNDETIAPSMRRLAELGIVSGESGAATLAGLAAICQNPIARMSLGIDHDSRILLLSTEGATDPEIYKKLVGVEASEIVTNLPI